MAKIKKRPRNSTAAVVSAAPVAIAEPIDREPIAQLEVAMSDDSIGELATLVSANESALALSEGFEITSDVASTGEANPYLGFFHPSARAADDIREKCGKLTTGTPYISAGGGQYYSAVGLDIIILNAQAYWAQVEDDGTMTEASLTRVEGLKKNILCPMLIVPGASELPEDLGHAFITLTNFRATKCKIAEQHNSAMERSTESGWAARNGALGGAVMQWPAFYRVASSIRLDQKTSKKQGAGFGKPYQQGSAQSHCLTADQIRGVAWWLQDEDCQAEAGAIAAAFRSKRDAILKLANLNG